MLPVSDVIQLLKEATLEANSVHCSLALEIASDCIRELGALLAYKVIIVSEIINCNLETQKNCK